ncbi:MAG: hypothetical protein ACT4OV_01975 [Microthrixaceae bacterium]
MTAPVAADDLRSNLEKLDDLQAKRPFTYNLVVGLLAGSALLLFDVHIALVFFYAVSYAALRWFLWQEGRVLHRQYLARAERWAAKQAARRRSR